MANIREYRERIGLTQLQVAENIKISVDSVRRYESGSSEPRATELIKMAKLFGCTVDQLLENPTPPLSEMDQGEREAV